MENGDIVEELQKIYNDVSEWLKFLETKHAAVFAAWVAVIVAVGTADFWETIDIVWKATVIAIGAIGILINLASFIPFLNNCKWIKNKCYKKYSNTVDNIVFYQSIFVSTYDEQDRREKRLKKYARMLKSRLDCDEENEYIQDYMNQIIDVSTVATIKAYLFHISVWYILIILFCVVMGVIIA